MYQIGRYEVEREIGRGAMGVVYAGFDPMLKRRVAVKTVLPDNASADQPWELLVKRLEREAQAAAALNHANIIAVYDIVQTAGMFCIVMEFVEGRSLADVVPLGSRSTAESAIRVLRDCAAGLDHAHARGVVHRDVKPGNIMLERAGGAKIADFGIAKLLNSSTDLTHGFALGTLEYMSPEQLNAMPVDGRTDQYALASVAYRLLTGSKIYDAESVGAWCNLVMTQMPTRATTRDPDLPNPVDSVLERGLAKKPEERYETCSQFVEELARALVPKVKPSTILIPATPSAAPSESDPIALTMDEDLLTIPHTRSNVLVYTCVGALLVALGILYFATSDSTPAPSPSIPVAAEGPKEASPLPKDWLSFPPESTAPVNVAKSPDGAVTVAGAKRVNPRDGLTYVWIAAGTFMMGCSPGDNECFDDEKPPHPVEITKGFWMGQTEVTKAAYRRVTGRNARTPSYSSEDDVPIETVAWQEAQAYCAAVGGRLPTEAQWEYAARAGNPSTRYGQLEDIAWYLGNSARQTHDVRRKQPNAYALYDMLGNVWEWTADWYGNYQYGSAKDPSGSPTGRTRSLRGGSWSGNPKMVRVSIRGGFVLGYPDAAIGFRCVEN